MVEFHFFLFIVRLLNIFQEVSIYMKKSTSLLLGMSLCASILTPLDSSVKAYSITKPNYSAPISVKLQYSALNKSSLAFTINSNYLLDVSPTKTIAAGTYEIKNVNGKIKLYQNNKELYSLSDTSLALYPQQYSKSSTMSLGSYKFLGNITFKANGANILPVNTLEQEDYLLGVVPFEISNSWPKEAIKAQTIAARTYSSDDIGKEVSNTTSYQVYNGYNPTYANTEQAVKETKGQVLTHNGKSIGGNALFSSSNGGMMLSKINSWSNPSWNNIPFLVRAVDPYDVRSGNSNLNWGFTLDKTQIFLSSVDMYHPEKWWNTIKEKDYSEMTALKEFIKRYDPEAKKYDIKIVSIESLNFTDHDDLITNQTPLNGNMVVQYIAYDPVTKDYIKNSNGKITSHFSEIKDRRTYDFYLYKAFGNSALKGPNISNFQETSTQYKVNGSGWGHGVGMSQWGAYQRAKEGQTAKQIVNFYYPGTQLTVLPTNSVEETPEPTPNPVTPTPDPVVPTPVNPTPDSEPSNPVITNPQYFEVMKDNVPVYDNRSGALVEVGSLTKGQQFKIKSDFGANWWQIEFAGHYGYVAKFAVNPVAALTYNNANNSYKNNGSTIQASMEAPIFDNTSGQLVQFATLKEGTVYPLLFTMGNWYVVDVNGRIGYIHNLKAKVQNQTIIEQITKPTVQVTKTYKVVSGDTLYKISVKNGVSVSDIQKWNNLKNAVIYIGQTLKVSK